MYYRMVLVDPLDTDGESGTQVEGLFTAEEIEQIRNRCYSGREFTRLICARPACGSCDTCEHARFCNH